MIFLLLAAIIGVAPPQNSVGSSTKENVHVTREMLISISEDLMQADIAEVDIDPAVFDLPPAAKIRKKSEFDEMEFISEVIPK